MNIALDTETFYSKEYSIRDLGNYGYTHHPEFDCYMLTAAYEDGRQWSGNPVDFDWESVRGHSWIMANAGFDLAVIARLQELGKVPPNISPIEVFDVLDLARYLGNPGNLAGAAHSMLGQILDKGTRDKAKGKHWHEMTPEFQKEMTSYALRDAVITLELFTTYGHLWPPFERQLSADTREMCKIGVPIDIEGVESAISNLEVLLWKIRTLIPWGTDTETTVLSRKSFGEECRKLGVTPPKSMAKDSAEFDEWLHKFGGEIPWATAIGSYRSMNMLLQKLIVMRDRTIIREGSPVMPIGIKYFGGHTGRDSGDTGFNPQNLPREPMFAAEMKEYLEKEDAGIDMRGKIMAPPGKVLGISDLMGIEPCVLAVLAEDHELVANLELGMDPYEAWARATKGYTDPQPLKERTEKQFKDLRKLCKVEILGLGYGAGAEKLIIIAKTLAGLELSLEEAQVIVKKFRSREFIPKLWGRLESAMEKAAPKDFTMELPSGREMRYRDVRIIGSISAVIPRTGKMMRLKYWGGTLVENLVQATAREVFMNCVVNLKAAGLPPILRVHDEAVCLFDEATAEADLAKMIKIMSTRPPWMPSLPTSATGFLTKHYRKD